MRVDPDWIVLRHATSVPLHMRNEGLEGRWEDRNRYAKSATAITGQAVAEPTGTFEVGFGGAVGEVWLIRLTTEEERADA